MAASDIRERPPGELVRVLRRRANVVEPAVAVMLLEAADALEQATNSEREALRQIRECTGTSTEAHHIASAALGKRPGRD